MSTLVNTVSKQVNLNGEQKSVHSSTVAELLAELGLAHKKLAVELNRKIVSRDSFTSTLIAEGDVIEIIDFVGGG